MFRRSLLSSSGPIPKFETATSFNVCVPSICRITQCQNSEYYNLNPHTRGNSSLTSFEDLLLILNYYRSKKYAAHQLHSASVKLSLNVRHDIVNICRKVPSLSCSVPTGFEAHVGDY
jgi:hypothetical protein